MSINDTGAPLSMDAQQTNRYALAVNDMQEVQQYLQSYHSIKQLLGVDSQEVIKTACQGVLSAAIVAYCRPFLGNHSEGFATRRVDASQLKSVTFRRALHDLLIQKRNSFIAHADWSARKAEVVISGTNDIHAAYTAPDVLAGLDLQEFLILAGLVFHECLGKTLEHGLAAQAGTPAA
jgi:hypothetical protein